MNGFSPPDIECQPMVDWMVADPPEIELSTNSCVTDNMNVCRSPWDRIVNQ